MNTEETGIKEKSADSASSSNFPKIETDRVGLLGGLRDKLFRRTSPKPESPVTNGSTEGLESVKDDPKVTVGKLVEAFSEGSDYHSGEVRAEIDRVSEEVQKAVAEVAEGRYGDRAVLISAPEAPKDQRDLDRQKNVSRVIRNSLRPAEEPVEGARLDTATPNGATIHSRVFATEYPGLYTIEYGRADRADVPGNTETYLLITKDGLDDRLTREARDGTLIGRYSTDARNQLNSTEEAA